jgi:hypothetical protein
MVQLLSAPEIVTSPDGVVEPPVTVTLTVTVSPGRDWFGVAVIVVVVGFPTICCSVSVLVAYVESPPYVPVSVLVPVELKVTVQLPVPLSNPIVQFVPAPVIVTVPVGVPEPPVTVAVTVTVSPNTELSGESVIVTLDTSVPPPPPPPGGIPMDTLARIVRALVASIAFPFSARRTMKGTSLGTMGL